MALRGTPSWWTDQFQIQVRDELKAIPDTEITQFVGLQDVAATEIYTHDIKLAKSADIMVALTRFPSLGLGMEIQARITLGKPTIVFHPQGQKLSGMVLGAPEVTVCYYNAKEESDGVDQVQQIITMIQARLQS